MSNEIDKQRLFDAIGDVSQENGMNGAKMKDALKNGDLSGVMSSLSPEGAQQLKTVLNDKEAAKKLLSSPEALKIMQMLRKGGKG